MAARFFGDLAGRLTGPLTARFLIQPAVATTLAIRDGVAKVFVVALVLDVVYQIMVHEYVYPGETLRFSHFFPTS